MGTARDLVLGIGGAILAGVVTLPEARSEDVFRVTGVARDDVLNIRVAPKLGAAVVGKVPADARDIVRVGECQAWCRVRYGSVEGWVDRRFLAPDAVSSSAEPQAAPSDDPIGDCNSHDNARKLTGCLTVITKTELPRAALAIAHSRLSDTYFEAGRLDAAVDHRAKAVHLQPDDTAYKLRLGQAHAFRAELRVQNGNIDGALADFTAMIEQGASTPEIYLARGSIYVQRKDYDSAIADLQMVAQLQGETEAFRRALAQVYEQRAAEHLLSKKLDAAIRDFGEAIKFAPSRDMLFLHRAAAHLAKGDLDSAGQDYVRAAEINPYNSETSIRRGQLARVRGLPHRALVHFGGALKQNPTNVTALMLRGLTHEELADFGEALADYRAVLKIDPSHRLAKMSLDRLKPTQPTAVSRKASDQVGPRAKQGCLVFNEQTFCN